MFTEHVLVNRQCQ